MQSKWSKDNFTLSFLKRIENETIRQKCIEAIIYSNREIDKIQKQKGSEQDESYK